MRGAKAYSCRGPEYL